MNASISIAMTAPKPVIMFVTVSIAMFVETVIQQSLTEARDYGSHFMATGCFLFPIWQPQVQPATTNCFVASESVAVPRNPFSSLGVTFITTPYTHLRNQFGHMIKWRGVMNLYSWKPSRIAWKQMTCKILLLVPFYLIVAHKGLNIYSPSTKSGTCYYQNASYVR